MYLLNVRHIKILLDYFFINSFLYTTFLFICAKVMVWLRTTHYIRNVCQEKKYYKLQ